MEMFELSAAYPKVETKRLHKKHLAANAKYHRYIASQTSGKASIIPDADAHKCYLSEGGASKYKKLLKRKHRFFSLKEKGQKCRKINNDILWG